MARSVIVLRGDARYEAGIANGAIGPGALVDYCPSEDPTFGTPAFIPHGEAGGVAAAIFADAYHASRDGKDIDTNIADEDSLTVIFPVKGAKINARTADTIARGEYVQSAGDGMVEPWNESDGYVVGQAAEDSDLSDTVGRVHIIII